VLAAEGMGVPDGFALTVRFGMAAGAAALLRSSTQLCRRSDVERIYAAADLLG
jgi:fructose-1-phosphate kinase PfkB-like protein